MEAFTIPQISMVTMALVIPGGWWLGDAALAIFSAESLFAFFYARHLGLDALIPISEPCATVAITILGIGLRMLRRHRRDLAREHVRARAEIVALDRVRPLFVTAREALEAQLATVASEIRARGVDRADGHPTSIIRAIDRLGDLGRKLDDLVAEEQTRTSAPDAERRLLEHDAQLGATLLVGLGLGLMLLATLWSTFQVGNVPTDLFAATSIVAFAMMVYLLHTQQRPSSRRALWAVLAMFATALPLVTYNESWLLEVNRPFTPFLAHKVLMVVLGLTMATRFKLGMVLIVATAAEAIALWFALDLGAHGDIISFTEPSITVLYMFIGLVSLRMNEQRQIASIQLLRHEAESSAMQRRALMLLALRDRLNSLLQTLVLRVGALELPASSDERIRAAIDRLINLSKGLIELEVPGRSTSLDADHELRRRT
jgi:hypothetical protein